jgi:hypothetical protein
MDTAKDTTHEVIPSVLLAQPNCPKRPRLVLRVGVTGHRIDKLPTGKLLDDLRTSIRDSLREIKNIVDEIDAERKAARRLTYSDEEPLLRLISPLAEGADRLVAQIAAEKGLNFELQCPLPFFEEEYKKDFPTSVSDFENLLSEANSVLQLDGSRESLDKRQEAYHMVGRTVLRQCDVLLAIWDGDPPSGEGGTGQIVQEALKVEVPIIWIHPQTRERYLLEHGLRPGEAYRKSDLSLLRKRIRRNVLPPGKQELKASERFFAETQPSWTVGFIFKVFCLLFVSSWSRPKALVRDFKETARKEWERTWEILSEAESEKSSKEKAQPLETGYLDFFAWADGLAEHYANLYRSSFVATYIMGALAILCAYLGIQLEAHGVRWAEIVLIVFILALTYWGRRRDWHGRWLDYRALAEELRQIQFLALMGRITSSFQVPIHLGISDPRNKWFNWYFRAAVREVGLVRAKLNSSYLDAYRQVLADWIRSQVDYHRRNAENHQKLHRRLLRLAHCLFFIALFSCVAHLCMDDSSSYELLLGIGTIVLPAFAGALGAIAHIGEFERTASRSEALKANLETLACQLQCLGEASTSRDLGQLAESFSKMALDELIDWRFSFLKKHLELPA